MTIRLACSDDIELLDEHLPPIDSHGGHTERLRSQEAGHASYLIAWNHDVPVGHVMVRWTGFRFGELPQRFPGIPVLLKLRVWPPQLWGHGIGTALMDSAEKAAVERGCSGIGLGVEIDNVRALRLYERLGYIDWVGGPLCEQITRLDAQGNEVPYEEVFTVLTKRFST